MVRLFSYRFLLYCTESYYVLKHLPQINKFDYINLSRNIQIDSGI